MYAYFHLSLAAFVGGILVPGTVMDLGALTISACVGAIALNLVLFAVNLPARRFTMED